ncbi:MAG TPA: DUF3047 domain-containing protein [Burkholderiaceae bacterium]|nr:DUF3047 domain-containing protein [Burkholderiaceae bacterium]
MRSVVAPLAAVLAGCASAPPAEVPASSVAAFSTNTALGAFPRGWQPWIINRAKTPTDYRLVRDPETGSVVLHAEADAAASGLRQLLSVDPAEYPIVVWRWRVVDLIVSADNADRYAEDSPVRLLLFFDGDKRSLSLKEQLLMETAQLLTGQALPYATLMYIWENRLPVDTVLSNTFSSQIKLIVASSGPGAGLGRWQTFERNYVDDYRRAFGASPGRLIGVGIMTDTDNTGERIEAFYGDIALRRAP